MPFGNTVLTLQISLLDRSQKKIIFYFEDQRTIGPELKTKDTLILKKLQHFAGFQPSVASPYNRKKRASTCIEQ